MLRWCSSVIMPKDVRSMLAWSSDTRLNKLLAEVRCSISQYRCHYLVGEEDKSALLKRAQQMNIYPDTKIVYADVRGCKDIKSIYPSTLFYRVCEDEQIPVPEKITTSKNETFINVLADQKLIVGLFYDNVDELYTEDTEVRYGWLQEMNALVNTPYDNFFVLLAGKPILSELITGYQAYVPDLMNKYPLHPKDLNNTKLRRLFL